MRRGSRGRAIDADETKEPFTAGEVELVAELSAAMEFGMRAGLADLRAALVAPVGPAVL